MNNILDEILRNTNSISSKKDFQEEFSKVLGDEIPQKNEPLAVFYREDILKAFKSLKAPIKIDKDMFYIWNGKYWSSLENGRVKRFISDYIKKRGLLLKESLKI